MNKIAIYYICLILALLLSALGAMLKIMHLPFSDSLLALSLPFAIIYIVLGIQDVARSSRLTVIEKLMWITAFIFVSGIAGIVYYSRFRKNFLRREKPGLRY